MHCGRDGEESGEEGSGELRVLKLWLGRDRSGGAGQRPPPWALVEPLSHQENRDTSSTSCSCHTGVPTLSSGLCGAL